MKTSIYIVKPLAAFACWLVVIGITFFSSTRIAVAEHFAEFGIARANIAKAIDEHKWVVCMEASLLPFEESRATGFDKNGNIFQIRGILKKDSIDLLSPHSYKDPRVFISTNEGYLFCWNAKQEDRPFEVFMSVDEYRKIIANFSMLGLLGVDNETSPKFRLLKDDPQFYVEATNLDRPRSIFDRGNPTAKPMRLGIVIAGRPNNDGCLIREVVRNSAAAEAGLEPNDLILAMAINGENVEMANGFPLSNDESIRIWNAPLILHHLL